MAILEEGLAQSDADILRQLIALVDTEIVTLNNAIDHYNATIREAIQDTPLPSPLTNGFFEPGA